MKFGPDGSHITPSCLSILLAALGGRRTAIDVVLQLLAGLEKRNPLGWHLDLGASFRIAPRAPPALASAKAAEAPYFDAVPALQRADNAFENGFHNGFGFFALKSCDTDDLFYEVRFCHGGIGHRCMLRQLLN